MKSTNSNVKLKFKS